MMSSIAFPKVAENNPLIVGFVCSEISFVEYPIIRASGTTAIIQVKNVRVSFFITSAEMILNGMNRSSQ